MNEKENVTEEEKELAKLVLLKHFLPDPIKMVVRNKADSVGVRLKDRVIRVYGYTGTAGDLMMMQAVLAVKISDFYREQGLEPEHWSLECHEKFEEIEFEVEVLDNFDEPEEDLEPEEVDLTELGIDKTTEEDGYRD